MAHKYAILMRPAGRYEKFEAATRDWLHEQYVMCCRTRSDLAAEKGASETTVARWAKHHGIPRRHGFRQPCD